MDKKKTFAGYLSKHKKYIDYRINTLSYYVSSGNSITCADSIQFIIDAEQDIIKSKINNDLLVCLQELRSLVRQWDILQDGDIVGYIYQEVQNNFHKKKKGQFFTPDDIVAYLAEQTVTKSMKILDPACGSGQFLIAVFKRLLTLHGIERFDVFSQKHRDVARDIIRLNIYGFDIDPIAIAIAIFNLVKISGCKQQDVQIFQRDFLSKDVICKSVNLKSAQAYDLIIGNPPWGGKLSIAEKDYYKQNYYSCQSGVNTFTLFIERCFDFLMEDATLAFLIPEAYLNIKAHWKSRELLLKKCQIKEIAIWGERFKNVYAPSISIIAQRENWENVRKKNIVHIKQESSLRDGTSILVPQVSFYNTPQQIININYSRKAVNIISSIEDQDCISLKDRATFFLGIVTGNNDRFIRNAKTAEHPDPIIIGKDISQYKINFTEHYFKYNPDILQQVAPQKFYKHKNKILYKFIGKRLTFALETNGYYSLNNVNGFIPQMADLNIESMLALLNSPVLQYYYEKNFFTVKVLRGNLERLPLKIISKENQLKLQRLAQSIIEASPTVYAALKENIDDIIFYEYGIADREAYLIIEEKPV